MSAERPSGSRVQAPPYMLHVVPGLEELAVEDLVARFPRARLLRTVQGFDERSSLLMIRYSGDADDLLALPMVEDVFVLAVDARGIAGGYRGLKGIRAAVETISAVERAAYIAALVRPKRRRKITFRVVTRMAGSHAFHRSDVQDAVEKAVLERFPAWLLVSDDAQLEFWVTLIEDELIAGIRLSDNTMRHRDYLATTLPASLKPTIAYALVTLTEPHPDDVFLDPMCGAGTMLIERALTSRYQLLLGGDIDPGAVRATEENIGPRFKPIEIREWDARELPLRDASVSAIGTNMPFGLRFGSEDENRTLYPALLEEWTRVLRPGGRMALLTGDRAHLRDALKRRPELRLEREVRVLVRGVPAGMYALRKQEPRGAGRGQRPSPVSVLRERRRNTP